MTNKDIAELIEAVQQINDEMYDTQVSWQQLYMLSVEIPWNDPQVKWLGVCIWDTNDDDREWIEADTIALPPPSRGFKIIPEHYEPWSGYLKKKMQEVIEQVNKIKV